MRIVKNTYSGVYHAQFRDQNGKTRTVTTRSKDADTARQIVNDSKIRQIEQLARVDRLTSGVLMRLTAGRKVTIASAFTDWCDYLVQQCRSDQTIQVYIRNFKLWLRDCDTAARLTNTITTEEMDAYINRTGWKASAGTRTQRRWLFMKFFRFCEERDWVLRNPMKDTFIRYDLLSHAQKEPRERQPITLEEYQTCLSRVKMAQEIWEQKLARAAAYDNPYMVEQSETNRFLHFAILIAWNIGLRIGDITLLEWDCFKEPRMATVWTHKRHRRISVPISQEVYDFLGTIPVMSAQYVFPAIRERYLQPELRGQLLHHVNYTILRWVPGKSFHCFRHSFTTNKAKEMGWELQDGERRFSRDQILRSIGRAIGHTNTNTTKGYLH